MNKIAFTQAITKHQQHKWLLYKIHKENRAATREGAAHGMDENQPLLHFVDQESLPNCPPGVHYQISQSKKYYWDITTWLSHNKEDMALEVHNGILSTSAESDTFL